MPPPRAAASAGGACLACAAALLAAVAATIVFRRESDSNTETREEEGGSTASPCAYESLIGSTPLVELTKLSALLGDGKSIWVKMECLNPGGTGKDRAALAMLCEAERVGDLPPPLSPSQLSDAEEGVFPVVAGAGEPVPSVAPFTDGSASPAAASASASASASSAVAAAVRRSRTGGIVVEGTSGSTGISLASLCAARGHSCVVVMPDDQASEKRTILACLGAVVHVVPNCAISNPNHYVNASRRIAETINRRSLDFGAGSGVKTKAAFMNQFENEANFRVHYTRTGEEIWKDASGRVDAFVMSSGTGGTISGVGRYLKERNPSARVVLVDPPGSALYNKVRHGVAYADQQSERSLLRHRYDTIAEGIGLDRVTRNFALGYDDGVIDCAERVDDQEAVDMAHWLLREEGMFVGSSSAFNLVGAVRTAAVMGRGCRVVTVVCDSGQRHLTRFWNRDFIREWGLEWPEDDPTEHRLPRCIADVLENRN